MCSAPRGFLGFALGPFGGASGAAPGALRAPHVGEGVSTQIPETRADLRKFMFVPLFIILLDDDCGNSSSGTGDGQGGNRMPSGGHSLSGGLREPVAHIERGTSLTCARIGSNPGVGIVDLLVWHAP
ncbi:unnamed protein product [Prorocentrum cordatum]|uniref:Secreted protein n=1 Tax=Prorocentrum cordatum TaxID=2364126 RepID=A0ABN9Q900_9DINO|nr:unnamed protein product [Polarella glacialis]